jgi:hypothetical protein
VAASVKLSFAEFGGFARPYSSCASALLSTHTMDFDQNHITRKKVPMTLKTLQLVNLQAFQGES